jgi:hypothetical protein
LQILDVTCIVVDMVRGLSESIQQLRIHVAMRGGLADDPSQDGPSH